jgi:peptidoglycan/xylan/chitin deacetylase (PgdA/CDA1 family)
MKKKLLAIITSWLGVAGLFIWLRRLFKKEVIILAYHRILDTHDNSSYLFDEELISANSETFLWQINFLKKHYDVISFSELSERLAGNKKLTGRELIITFDDGFSDNYSNAYRLLDSVNIPAVFYISTAYIGTDKTFWFNEVVHAIKVAKRLSFSIADEAYDFEPTNENKEKAIQLVLNKLKEIPNSERLNAIESLYRDLDFHADNIPASELPMTWENINEMASNNMEIGSHAASHPILSRLTDKEMKQEIIDSKQTIESITKKECRTIAYPVGERNAFTEKVQEVSEAAGYEYGLSYISGNNKSKDLKKYSLARLHVERYTNHEEFKLMLYFPEIYSTR